LGDRSPGVRARFNGDRLKGWQRNLKPAREAFALRRFKVGYANLEAFRASPANFDVRPQQGALANGVDSRGIRDLMARAVEPVRCISWGGVPPLAVLRFLRGAPRF
jgi:hypothetical protein